MKINAAAKTGKEEQNMAVHRQKRGVMRGIVLAAGLAALLATGCVPTTQTTVNRDPNMVQNQNVKLDFTQLYNDTVETFGGKDENPYVFISAFDVQGDDSSKVITVTGTCIDQATKEEVQQFAAAAVRHINDAAVMQSNEYAVSSQESFGTLWDKYELKLAIYPASAGDNAAAEGDASKAVLNIDVKPGEEIPLNPDIETYEEAWQDERDKALSNIVYDAKGNVVSK